MNEWQQFRTINKGEFIVCAVDTASGGLDYTAAQFLSKTKIDVPLVFHSKITTSDFIPSLHRILEKIFTITGVKPYVALERQNGGSFLMDRLAGLNLNYKYELFKMPNFGRTDPPQSVRLGFDMNTASRPKALQDLKDAIDKKVLTIYDKQTINELYSFIVVQTSSSWKAQAEKNAHDDLVMALAISWQLYQMCETPKPESDNLDEVPKENLFNEGGFY